VLSAVVNGTMSTKLYHEPRYTLQALDCLKLLVVVVVTIASSSPIIIRAYASSSPSNISRRHN